MKQVICILLIVCLLMVAAACAAPDGKTPQYEEEYKLHDGTKAIVILPGLLASGLYDVETGEALWDPIEGDDVDMLEFMGVYDQTHQNVTIDTALNEFWSLWDIVSDILADNDRSLMRRIMCDDLGEPSAVAAAVPTDYEGHIKYGALNSYKWWVEGLKEVYGEQYEVVVYNYNWLTDTRYAARDFAEFMRRNNYTDSILIGHSMGGIVGSEYLALGAENRARIDKFIAVAVPFYGSYMACTTLENPYGFMQLIDDMLSSVSFDADSPLSLLDLGGVRDGIGKLYDKMIIPFLYNMKSVYQLLPSAELLRLQEDIEGDGIYEDGRRIDAAALFDWYRSRPFARTDPRATKAAAASLEERAIFADWQAYRDGFYVDKPEGKTFSCDLVDTYYLVGVGHSTTTALVVEGERRVGQDTRNGDGTVPTLSATRGRSLADDHVYAVEGMTHIPMGCLWAGGQKEAVLAIIGSGE